MTDEEYLLWEKLVENLSKSDIKLVSQLIKIAHDNTRRST